MKSTDRIGLVLVGGGILLLTLYGLYRMNFSDIDPLVLIAGTAICLGTVILIISTLTTKKCKEMENITKEDLRP